MPSPFATAILDHHRDERDEPLIQRDGEWTREHPIEAFYFGAVDPADDRTAVLEEHLQGPLLDLGAGAGRDALYFQERFETVALEVEEPLVRTMAERGVENPVHGDMFDLTATFEPDRFAAVLAFGTQLGLAKSIAGLRAFFEDLATVTTDGATAVVDCYDPTRETTTEMLGFRPDEAEGLAYRVMQFEYDGRLGDPLLFRLFSPDRLEAAAADAGWSPVTYRGRDAEDPHYIAAFEKC
jgi:hypothetical protein